MCVPLVFAQIAVALSVGALTGALCAAMKVVSKSASRTVQTLPRVHPSPLGTSSMMSTVYTTVPSGALHMSSTSLSRLLAGARGPGDVVLDEHPVGTRSGPTMRWVATPAGAAMPGDSPVTGR